MERGQGRQTAMRVSGMAVGFAASLSQGPLQPRWRGVLRYSGSVTMTTGAAGVSPAGHYWNLNSLFDPDQTSFGHYPYYYDQLKVLYARYFVPHARCTVIATNVNTNGDDFVHVAITDASNAFAINALSSEALIEKQSVTSFAVSQAGGVRNKVVFDVPIHTIFGNTARDLRAEESLYSAVVGANPSKLAFMGITVSSPNGTAASSATITVLIEYTAELFEPIGQAQST